MTRRILLWTLGAGYWGAAGQARAAEEVRSEKVVYIGDTRVRILVAEVRPKDGKSFVYFHPHENEHSSAVVTRHAIQQSGGKLVEVRSQGERLVTFQLKGLTYSFDPNRMFTDVGLQHSLFHYGPTSPGAFEEASKFRNAVLSQLGDGKTPIISLHNNTQDEVSVLSYKKGHPLQEQAAKIAVNPKENPHDFFLVSDEGVFARLHHAGFNAVLLSPSSPDDGSLAVFCRQNKWYYVSVQALESEMTQQQRMLDALPEAIG